MQPLLSICVMTYNRVRTLRETLDSLLPQAEPLEGVEVLISDNASTDNTEEIAREYLARYRCLRYSRNLENLGFDGNVVACLENAAGEYVAYFSDDDIAGPGMVAALLKDLEEVRPVAAYINHAPFFNDNSNAVMAPTQPVVRKIFDKPSEFFLFAGLGFISALVLKRSEALKHTHSIVADRGTAHVDIGSRTVLSSEGPFLFDGTITVLGRVDYTSGYDPLRMGAINTTIVHKELLAEGLITGADMRWYDRKTIRLFLPRLIVNNRIRGGKTLVPAKELRELYGADPLFYLYAWPLLMIPPKLLRAVALAARGIMRSRRRQIGGKKQPEIS